MSKTILYSLENISSSLKSCRNIAIAPDFYDTIYVSNSLHRYSVIYQNRPYYIYVVISKQDRATRFIELAEQLSLYDKTPFQKFEYYSEQLLSYDDNREGRYYDIILSERYGDVDIIDSLSTSRYSIKHAISLFNTILWLVYHKKTVTNLALSQIKIDGNSVKIEFNSHNQLIAIRDAEDYDVTRKLLATSLIMIYLSVNQKWCVDIQSVIESGWKSSFDDTLNSLIIGVDREVVKESLEFIKGGSSVENMVKEINCISNLSDGQIEQAFKLESALPNFYDSRRYTIHSDLSSELCYAISDNESGKFGFIDTLGRAITEMEYDSVTPFNESISVVVKKRSYYAINRDGEKLLSGSYAYIKWCSDENVFIVADRKHNYFLLSRQGETISRSTYAKIENFCYNRAIIVGFDGGQGFIDPNGNEILPPTCQQVLEYDDGIAYAKLNNQWYIIGYDGDMYLKNR